ncbi:hypothetical protein HWV62_17768 [Athelia sp. TMB]|nr:hypothetical protein HWV62_17768 [Athelia sp. TMB]
MSASEIDEIIRNAIDNGIIPGVALVAFNKSGTVDYAKAFGKTGVSPESKPLTLESTFWIASCTKLLTTIACMQCVEQGLLSLDSSDDVAKLLPEYAEPEILTGFDDQGKPVLKRAKNSITLRHMLSHSSGMGYDFATHKLDTWRKSRNEGHLAYTMSLQGYIMPLVFEPGEDWEYGSGLDWAGAMVERASGLKLEAYMKKNIWEPLGIESIAFHLERNEEVRRQLVSVSARVPSTGLLVHSPDPVISDPAEDAMGGAGAYGSPAEYAKVLRSILIDDGKLLKGESVDEMFRPQLSEASKRAWMERVPDGNIGPAGTEMSWGLGGMTNLKDVEGRRRKGSLAWGGYPNLFWWIDREAGIAGIYASQVLPPGDEQSRVLFSEFEKMVYKLADTSK